MGNSPLTQEEAVALAARLLDAISAFDIDRIRQVYTPDATIWNNHTPGTVGIDELIVMLTHLHGAVQQMTFEPVRTQVTSSGFIDQHVTHFVTNKGVSATLPSCMIVGVRDGRIATVEEYANPADMAPLMAELMEAPSTTS
jgi:ketosteroid isomerase-like protein